MRIPALDLARTAALVGMIAFHFTFDLEMFGYAAPGTTVTGFFYYFARLVAGSFLFLAGVSLYLAHVDGIRWRPCLRRMAIVVGAALLVSVASIWVTPGGIIVFGILHAIALCSLIGLAFLRVPAVVTLAVAGVVFALPFYVSSDAFNSYGLLWIGLSDDRPPMSDYVPVLPWLAPCLAGIAFAKLATGLWQRLRTGRAPSRLVRVLAWPGQHSLVIYLLHQPVMVGLFWAITSMLRT